MGVAGERGPKGDHGQHGEHGAHGEAGLKGATGARGATGPQGKTEPATIWFGVNRWTYAGLAFFLIVTVGAYSTYRTDQRFHEQIDRVEQASIDTDYRTCLGDNKIRAGIRSVLEGSFAVGNPRREAVLSQFIIRDCEGEFPMRSSTAAPIVKAP